MLFSQTMIDEAVQSFKKSCDITPEVGIILGSGMGAVADGFEKVAEVDYCDIRHMGQSCVAGHRNKFITAIHAGKNLLIMQGRIHLYEGFSAFECALPVAIMGELGVNNLIITNAAGGINNLSPGDIMQITDHINLQAVSPLIGHPENARFIDMTAVYQNNPSLTKNFGLKEGVYAGVLGPNYETPAEIRYLAAIGTDAVGMSTVQEAIMARYYKMRITGLSLITNLAAGISGNALSHEEVVKNSAAAIERLQKILCYLIEER